MHAVVGSGTHGPRAAAVGGLVALALVAGATPAGAAAAGPPTRRSTGDATSAATLLGWGEPARVDEFDGTAPSRAWEVYDGPGHAGEERRTPEAVSVRDGVLTIIGSPRGDTAGMAWGTGRRHGRWEARVKAPVSDE